jgi:hypothetical protein
MAEAEAELERLQANLMVQTGADQRCEVRLAR